MNPSERTIEYRGCKIVIEHDQDCKGPRKDNDNFGTMACWHRRYSLGDLHCYRDPITFQREALRDVSPFRTENMALDKLSELFNRYFLWRPIFLYDHSGLTISTQPFSCQWDSMRLGYIYVTKQAAMANWNKRSITAKTGWLAADGTNQTVEAAAMRLLQGEVDEYDSYLRGEVYSYTTRDPDGNQIGACAGFLGADTLKDDGDLLTQAKESIDEFLAKQPTLQPA